MQEKKPIPLGYVDLACGESPIYPMNDVLLNHMFEDVYNWSTLRLAINIILEAYRQYEPATSITPIQSNIRVRTQFRYIASLGINDTHKEDDVDFITDKNTLPSVELHSKWKHDLPKYIVPMTTICLEIGHNFDKTSMQIWLLSKDAPPVLHGNTFANYVFKSEDTGEPYPNSPSVMYVNLPKLSQEKSPAGELASFLLGKAVDSSNDDVNAIIKTFRKGFNNFCEDGHVMRTLLFEERCINEGIAIRAKKRAEFEASVIDKIHEREKEGVDPAEILNEIEGMMAAEYPNFNQSE